MCEACGRLSAAGRRERNAGYRELEAAIREGIDSGESDRTVAQIMEEVEARLRADGRL